MKKFICELNPSNFIQVQKGFIRINGEERIVTEAPARDKGVAATFKSDYDGQVVNFSPRTVFNDVLVELGYDNQTYVFINADDGAEILSILRGEA